MAQTPTPTAFDPNGPAPLDANIFGLPYAPTESELVLIPMPWDVTVSYADGTSEGPQAIFEASAQVDLFLRDVPQAWNNRVSMLPVPKNWRKTNRKSRKMAKQYLQALLEGAPEKEQGTLKAINEVCATMNQYVFQEAQSWLDQGKAVGLVGGDHSTPLGLIQAMATRYPSFSVLQFDAHCDLREAYEGFTYSHASVSYNFMQLPQIDKLVQVGIRDLCEEEHQRIQASQGRIKVFFDEDIQENKAKGIHWQSQMEDMLSHLGSHVYITFDIDAFEPSLCPNTGTPVPGGLQFQEAIMLIRALRAAGKTIIGFDLVEVAPGKDEWDANVGARLLFRLSQELILSQRIKTPKKSKTNAPARKAKS